MTVISISNKSMDNFIAKDFDSPGALNKYFHVGQEERLSEIDDQIALRLSIDTVKITYNNVDIDYKRGEAYVQSVLNRDYNLT